MGRQDILIAGGKIVAMRESLSVPDGWPIEEVDLASQHVIPGLIDQHIHLAGGGGTGGPATANDALAFEAAVECGLTTVVGCLGYDTIAKSLVGLLAKCRALQQEGISALMYTGGLTEPKPMLSTSLAADLVMFPEVIGIKGGVLETRGGPRTTGELLQLAGQSAAAQLAGKVPRLHLHVGRMAGSLGIVTEALDAGLDAESITVTHCNISASVLEQAIDLGRRGVRLDVTAALTPTSSEGAVDPVSGIQMMIEAGVDARRLTLSSDSNGASAVLDDDGCVVAAQTHGPRVLTDALWRLAAARGLDSSLPMVTSNVADGLGLRHKGRLTVGADADIVVLSDAHEIRHVWANGVRHVEDGSVVTGSLFRRHRDEPSSSEHR